MVDSTNRELGVADTQVYARGMLIAFLLDVAMPRESKGRNDISEVSQRIYQRYSKETGKDGNAAVLEAIGMPEFAKQYILGAEKFNIEQELAGSGIVLETAGRSPVLQVRAKPSGREKEILDRLGYNNWRKGTGNLNK